MTLSSLSVQRSKSLYEQTYEALRASILSGDLAPGQRLVETQLAERLQVSRTPIREAMRQLQRDTLVTADSSGGLRVASLSVEDVIQLYDCRLALEQFAVQGACQHATPEQVRSLEQLVTQSETLSKSQTEYSPAMLDLDYRFHRLIAESSGNRWLVSLLDQVFDKMALLRVQTTRRNPRVLEIRQEHRQIFETIQTGWRSRSEADISAAVAAIRTHLIASQARVTQEVENLQHGVDG
ncbi:GntR family transcriptional regulator [Thermoleptolyngbya sp. M55_K2018_002]|uniref:GntR family transcriptional regulator n=1 Tax=Thermoleptolyngbya sp. M55_K2018_002 TaxID=2747808 RepID=UPI0019F67048|nr:GntR family transcriptional regulator [Thermoleptolyngbya sp. M55_K2018_002]HIK39553.1 GntR family transcriptional regulator [Thermoleptolyngbya sp. M55_K2018_002]